MSPKFFAVGSNGKFLISKEPADGVIWVLKQGANNKTLNTTFYLLIVPCGENSAPIVNRDKIAIGILKRECLAERAFGQILHYGDSVCLQTLIDCRSIVCFEPE